MAILDLELATLVTNSTIGPSNSEISYISSETSDRKRSGVDRDDQCIDYGLRDGVGYLGEIETH